MTVSDFIEYLKTQPQDLHVAYRCYSEQCLIDVQDITVEQKCVARPDGWIQHLRPDKPTQTYLMLPGN